MKLVKLAAGWLIPVGVCAILFGCGPSTPVECVEQGAKAAADNNWHLALKLADKGTRLAPDNIDAWLLKAAAAHRCRQPEAAFEAASRAVGIDPRNFAAQYTLGRVCMDDPRRTSEAFRALRLALRLRRGDRDTLVALCNLAAESNSPNAVDFLKMLALDPDYAESPVLHNQLGIIYLRREDYANAKAEFVKAWKLDKNDPDITYNTARFFDRHTPSFRVAARLYGEYLRLTAGDQSAEATRKIATERFEALGGTK